MNALSLWQIWAAAMAARQENGLPVKAIETRHWPIKMIPPFDLAIHAAKMRFNSLKYDPEFVSLCRRYRLLDNIVYGAFVCIVRVIEIKKVDELRDSLSLLELAFGNYINVDDSGNFQQRYGFVTDPTQLRVLKYPVYAVGRQGLFKWNPPARLEFR